MFDQDFNAGSILIVFKHNADFFGPFGSSQGRISVNFTFMMQVCM